MSGKTPAGVVIPIPAELREALADVNEIAIRAKSLYRRAAPLLAWVWRRRRSSGV